MKPKKAIIPKVPKFSEKIEDDFYHEENIEDSFDNDLINPAEQGFMIGYLNA